MKTALCSLLLAFLVFGCMSSSISSGTAYLSVLIENSTSSEIEIELRTDGNPGSIAAEITVPAGENNVLIFPLAEGWHYAIAIQGGKKAQKPFLIKNGSIVGIVGNQSQSRIVFASKDFQ